MMPGAPINIPLGKTNEYIEIDTEDLPDGLEVLTILEEEKALFSYWVETAKAYYEANRINEFTMLIEAALERARCDYKNYERDRARVYDILAIHYVNQARHEKSIIKRTELRKKATHLFTTSDKTIMYDLEHLVCRGYFCLFEDGKMENANNHFNFILRQTPNCIRAILGKAYIAYHLKNYAGALTLYLQALELDANGEIEIRLNLAKCLIKLKQPAIALICYERALKMDPDNVRALIGKAILFLNLQTASHEKTAVKLLSKAYTIDNSKPMILNLLANYFFLKQDYDKVHHLAMHAVHNAENEAMRAQSCYQVARSFHVSGNYDEAFQYYYMANQMAPGTYVLPYYGLGQMYIHRGDEAKAIACFEKVLKMEPDNCDAMKILGILFANSPDKQKRDQGRDFLKKVSKLRPDDRDVWIEIAKFSEKKETQASLKAYLTASTIFEKKYKIPAPPEILSNIAATLHRLDNIQLALDTQLRALQRVKELSVEDVSYYESISVTMKYNLARLYEIVYRTEEADQLYKSILKEHPNYIDCFLRLGCMARDKGLIFVASDFFKDALHVQNNNPEARIFLGNLHLAKKEYGPGQKSFEMILKDPSTSSDSFSLVALGNFALQMMQNVPACDTEKKKKFKKKALDYYLKVLNEDPKNIWAANGIGCVLAHKGYVHEARDIFSQVRESTAIFSDVWLNIGHIYVEQGQMASAIQMYNNYMKNFKQVHNVEVMQYLARAYMRLNKLKEAKEILTKARHVAPHNHVLMFNISLVIFHLARATLKEEKITLAELLQTVNELNAAQRSFHYLSLHGNPKLYNLEAARFKANQCKDLISQAQYNLDRIRYLDAEEKKLRRKQEEDRLAFHRKLVEERKEREEKQKSARDAILAKRREFVEKTKQILLLSEPTRFERNSKRDNIRGRYKKDDTSDDEVPQKTRKSKGGRKRGRKNYHGQGTRKLSSTDSKNRKISSKEIITSESDSDSDEGNSIDTQKDLDRKRSHSSNGSASEGDDNKRQKLSDLFLSDDETDGDRKNHDDDDDNDIKENYPEKSRKRTKRLSSTDTENLDSAFKEMINGESDSDSDKRNVTDTQRDHGRKRSHSSNGSASEGDNNKRQKLSDLFLSDDETNRDRKNHDDDDDGNKMTTKTMSSTDTENLNIASKEMINSESDSDSDETNITDTQNGHGRSLKGNSIDTQKDLDRKRSHSSNDSASEEDDNKGQKQSDNKRSDSSNSSASKGEHPNQSDGNRSKSGSSSGSVSSSPESNHSPSGSQRSRSKSGSKSVSPCESVSSNPGSIHTPPGSVHSHSRSVSPFESISSNSGSDHSQSGSESSRSRSVSPSGSISSNTGSNHSPSASVH